MSSIVIVSGMPRSGTSMLMKALKDGGLEPLTDGVRTPNEDNPNGYFEYEPVKNLKNDNSWMKDAIGKSVKIIYKHLNLLPTDYQYKIIFVERNIDEIISSQKKMLINMGKKNTFSNQVLKIVFEKEIQKTKQWLLKNKFEVLYVWYNLILSDPKKQMERVKNFVESDVDLDKMVSTVDPKLYRTK